LQAQLLAGPPARDPVSVVERLLAVQSQDLRGARLAIRARARGLTASDVDRAMTVDRSLLVTWLNRGTLHLIRAEDYALLHALTTPPLHTANARRLAQEGVSRELADRGVKVVERSLSRDGPLTRRRLAERLREAGIPTAGQALVHVLMAASLRGVCVRGPVEGAQHAYVLVRDWLPEPPSANRSLDRDRALAELARRYLAGHGPATDRDLARWAGLPLADARAGLRALALELREREDGLAELKGRRLRPELPPPRLLGPFEPVALGWASRQPLFGDHDPLVVSGGLFRPFALVRGRAAAVWSLRGTEVDIRPFRRLAPDDRAALDRDAADVVRFLGPS
jgi:uncharacterized protein YcaQ